MYAAIPGMSAASIATPGFDMPSEGTRARVPDERGLDPNELGGVRVPGAPIGSRCRSPRLARKPRSTVIEKELPARFLGSTDQPARDRILGISKDAMG